MATAATASQALAVAADVAVVEPAGMHRQRASEVAAEVRKPNRILSDHVALCFTGRLHPPSLYAFTTQAMKAGLVNHLLGTSPSPSSIRTDSAKAREPTGIVGIDTFFYVKEEIGDVAIERFLRRAWRPISLRIYTREPEQVLARIANVSRWTSGRIPSVALLQHFQWWSCWTDVAAAAKRRGRYKAVIRTRTDLVLHPQLFSLVNWRRWIDFDAERKRRVGALCKCKPRKIRAIAAKQLGAKSIPLAESEGAKAATTAGKSDVTSASATTRTSRRSTSATTSLASLPSAAREEAQPVRLPVIDVFAIGSWAGASRLMTMWERTAALRLSSSEFSRSSVLLHAESLYLRRLDAGGCSQLTDSGDVFECLMHIDLEKKEFELVALPLLLQQKALVEKSLNFTAQSATSDWLSEIDLPRSFVVSTKAGGTNCSVTVSRGGYALWHNLQPHVQSCLLSSRTT